MTKFQIAHSFAVRDDQHNLLSAEELHAEGERLMEALLGLERCNGEVSDATTASEADHGCVIIELFVEADSPSAALEKFFVVSRSAIHAIGGWTLGWDKPAQPNKEYDPRSVQLEYV